MLAAGEWLPRTEGVTVARDEKIDLLRTVPLFAGLDDHEIERVSTLADIIDLPADRLLMTQGQHGWEMFILVSGSARVERDGKALGDRGPGEVLGEIALLDGGPRTATVRLSEPSRLLVLARRARKRRPSLTGSVPTTTRGFRHVSCPSAHTSRGRWSASSVRGSTGRPQAGQNRGSSPRLSG